MQKKSSLCVLKDCSGIEGLTEQLSAILFSRFLDANDINAADTLEVFIIIYFFSIINFLNCCASLVESITKDCESSIF